MRYHSTSPATAFIKMARNVPTDALEAPGTLAGPAIRFIVSSSHTLTERGSRFPDRSCACPYGNLWREFTDLFNVDFHHVPVPLSNFPKFLSPAGRRSRRSALVVQSTLITPEASWILLQVIKMRSTTI